MTEQVALKSTSGGQLLPAMDFVKFLLAFVVVGIHTEVFSQIGLLDMGFGVISRVAVPFFFAASGFLFFRQPPTGKRVWKFSKRILLLYGIYSAVFFVFSLFHNGEVDPWFWVETLCSGYRHLWFLHALLFGMLLTSVLVRYIRKTWIIYGLAAFFLIFDWALSTSYPLFDGIGFMQSLHDFFPYITTKGIPNTLGFAFPYIVVGYAVSRYQGGTLRRDLIGAAIFLILLAAETYFSVKILQSQMHILFLSCVPLIFFMLSASRRISWPRNERISLFLRKNSTLIYCIHPLFVMAIGSAVEEGILLFLLCSACALVFAMLVYLGSQKKWGRALKYLQ